MPVPVFLWTDVLLWILVALTIFTIFYSRQRRHLAEPWKRVFRSRVAVGSLVVLMAFISIGLLDSIHFRGAESSKSGEVVSLFDLMVSGLRERQEKTYSAPFATHLYAKETVKMPDGTEQRIYPRLVHGGSHLAEGDSVASDIYQTIVVSAFQALAIWLVLLLLIALWRKGDNTLRQTLSLWICPRCRVRLGIEKGFPWATFLWTLLVILLLAVIAANLSQKYHILGTDKVGEDVFYQALKSIRTGLVLGTLTTLVMLPAAILLGVMAGYFRGWVDDAIQYLYTTLNSIPSVLLIAAAVLMLQVYMDNNAEEFTSSLERADMRLLFLCIILGVTSWTGLCRLLRGESLKIRELDYVQAAQAFGVGHFRILMRHLVPNVMHIVLIAVVLDFSGLVLAEAVLSYINIGVDPTTNSWGNMINSARLEMAREPIVWWSLFAAFAFMFSLVLAANLFSDVVRDAFDPRLKGKL
ncbi:MAG: ABC transporter permease [Gammaproteobacteria bacterium]